MYPFRQDRSFDTPNPHKQVALCGAEGSLTYEELDRASTHLANHLVSQGMKQHGVAAIAWPRSFQQIIAALAVMRVGAAYVPLDPSWPAERMRYILADSGATVLIAPEGSLQDLPEGVSLVDPKAQNILTNAPTAVHYDAEVDPDSLAYIIYTSGSTGTPKGVEITHDNLGHLIRWHCEAFSVTSADRASHLAGLGFDASVWEVWPYLATGACVVLADDLVRTSPALLQEWIVAEEVTIAFVPTPLAEPMLAEQWPLSAPLRFLLTGGDTLHSVPRTDQPFVVVNNYGPTECTVVATSGVVAAGHTGMPTLGKAISGTRAYVVNELGALMPDGEIGELVLGGRGVGRGYRNQPELTARSFIPDLLSEVSSGRLYKTGDRASLRPNGEIVFHGRMDGQEKIRGQRLELDEITCVLNKHESIAFSVVIVHGVHEEKHLVAYVLPVDGRTQTISGRELQQFLAESLPSYMIPVTFVRLTSIPLSSNGKLDATNLPPITDENVLAELFSRAPSSPTEETLLMMVRTLLQNQNVGVDDDFFLVGGHSLMGTRLVMRVREAFGVNLMLRDLFEAGTVSELASHVESMIIAEFETMSEEEAIRQVVE